MAMLGTLHKLTLGTAPAQLAALLPVLGAVHEPAQRQGLRRWRPLHTKQLYTPVTFTSSDLAKRSLLGLVHTYNALPQSVVDSPTVSLFQKRLQRALLRFGDCGAPNWQRLYSDAWKGLPRQQLDALCC